MNEENKAVIKALNMYGRVPEQYELLEEIERLKIIEEKYKDSQLYIHDFKEEIEKLNNIITDLQQENKQLQQQRKKQKEVIDKVMNLIKKYGKYDGEKCTQGFQMWSADFNKILDILKEVSE